MTPYRNVFAAAFAGCALVAAAPFASAHISVSSPAFAGDHAVLTFSIGHGCSGADTYSIDVHLPDAVLSLRARPSAAFGNPTIATDSAQLPTDVVWTKTEVTASDSQYYELEISFKIPDVPFTTLYFPVTQKCRAEDGTESTVEWSALPGEDGEPAAALVVLPPHHAGWNQYTVPAAIDDLEAYFGSAQIVWAGNAAYSANPSTATLIEAEDGVDTLTTIDAGAEIWVKY